MDSSKCARLYNKHMKSADWFLLWKDLHDDSVQKHGLKSISHNKRCRSDCVDGHSTLIVHLENDSGSEIEAGVWVHQVKDQPGIVYSNNYIYLKSLLSVRIYLWVYWCILLLLGCCQIVFTTSGVVKLFLSARTAWTNASRFFKFGL